MNAIILDNKKGRASSSSKNFGGVRYNTNKMDKGKGELMALRNFGAIKNDTHIKPDEVKQYLISVAQLNPKKEKKQFHAVISCKGKEYDKHQLTDVAHEWVKRMGYCHNPYIIVFHNDTENNHVHIVSSRIDIHTGATIPDSFENVRAVKFIDQIMKEKHSVDRKLEKSDFTQYNVTTLAQFKLLHETIGRSVSEKNGKLNVYDRGLLIAAFEIKDLMSQIENNSEDKKRADQLKAIFTKYLADFEGVLQAKHQNLPGNRRGKITGYHSDFTEFMRQRFGFQFVFHFSGDKEPYGYTIIDHKNKAVFKGSTVMKLSELTKSPDHKVNLTYIQKKAVDVAGFNTESVHHIRILAKQFKIPAYRISISERKVTDQEKAYYKDLLSLYLKSNHLSTIGDLNMEMVKEGGKWHLIDKGAKTILNADEVLSREEIQSIDDYYRYNRPTEMPNLSALNPFGGLLDMAAAISADSGDDSKKNRKKKR